MDIKLLFVIFFVCFTFCQVASNAQSYCEEHEILYYKGDLFLLEGKAFSNNEKENPYHRLPEKYKEKVRDIVWDLSKCSAGMSIRFLTNSTGIHVKWNVINSPIANRNHMADTGVMGIDLYFKNGKNWQYVNTARPNGKVFDELLVENMDNRMKEFRLYLPLYIELTDIQIGVDKNSKIEKVVQNSGLPIVFYGTSITQGGCASRPAMAHTNIVSRKTGTECINLGFRGNGKMEPEIADIIKEINAKFYVIECLPNMTKEQVLERTLPFVEIIRKKRKNTPIVFVENLMFENSCLDYTIAKTINDKNLVLKNEYNKIKNIGYNNLYFIGGENALGNDHEATVDGTHLTDLGFSRYADFLIQNFQKFSLL